MDKYFICLANSYKHGGRCIAGIEVVPLPGGQLTIVHHNDGRPRWIRPVSMAENGEIPNRLAQGVKLLSLVKLTEVIPCPDKAHTEDVHCSRMECCPYDFEADNNFLSQFIDPVHQAVFYYRGKAIPATMINRLDYSLMLIRPEKASAYIDDEREKSKYRMKFTYYGSNYDFPITDPCFLETFKKNPDRYTNLKGIYLTLSLGLEFEGFHFKLVAAVIQTEEPLNEEKADDWFEEYDKALVYLIEQKKAVEEQIASIRTKIVGQMEQRGLEKVASNKFVVVYTPAKTIMQFDSKAFRMENEDLYTHYCKPHQKEAFIVVRRKQPNEEDKN